ncbi:MAG: hypothetical protein KJN89_00170 [Gammaproteobacteria bacterium]|nr:hypothetical protein [Gammaproteobacteria bacterium]MBT8133730.1 hypothetical protein [Gammaproteobacteria bacterium]NNJ48755.1 hypothetical protein [Gammaproteobacteria bacterium]
MTFKYINTVLSCLLAANLAACGSSSSSGDSSAVTSVSMRAAPSPANAPVMLAGNKVFTTAEGHTVTLTKAYLVISSTTIETTCGANFSAALESVIDVIVPRAHAHTTTTPTSTGVPYVIDLLAADNVSVSIGGMSPAVADYCGVDIDLFAADDDAINLPVAAGEPDMIGRTVYIEGSYSLSGGGAGAIKIDTGATLINRYLQLSALMMISASSPTGSVSLGINYDTWFDAVDLAVLETETAVTTSPSDANVGQVLQNITASIHQL